MSACPFCQGKSAGCNMCDLEPALRTKLYIASIAESELLEKKIATAKSIAFWAACRNIDLEEEFKKLRAIWNWFLENFGGVFELAEKNEKYLVDLITKEKPKP